MASQNTEREDGMMDDPIVTRFLDHVIFSKYIRDLIVELRNNGDFRNEAVKHVLKKWIVVSVTFSLVAVSLVFYFRNIESILISVLILGLWLLAAYEFRENVYYLPTKGLPVDGLIKEITFSPRLYVGWVVDYSYQYKSNNTYLGRFFIHYVFQRLSVKEGDPLVVLVDLRNPKKSIGLRRLDFFEPCLSKFQFQRFTQMKALGV